MKKKKVEYLLAAAALGGMLCLSACSGKKPEPVSQNAAASDVQPEETEETAAQSPVHAVTGCFALK